MLHQGQVKGAPLIEFLGDKADIEANFTVSGMVAYAQDTGELGYYGSSGTWVWIDATGGAGHNPVTLGVGSDACLALAGQELTLCNVATQAELDTHAADVDVHIGANYYAALAGTSGAPSVSNKYVTNDDTDDSPAIGDVVRVDTNGDIVVPGDYLGEGETASIAGLYRLLGLSMGAPAKAKLYDSFYAGPNRGYYLKDATWLTWALGLGGSGGSLALSDEFLQDNYDTEGTTQWQDYASAVPSSVSVGNSFLTLTSKRSGDSSASHAAIAGTFSSARDDVAISARVIPRVIYYQKSGATLDYVTGLVCMDTDREFGFGVFLRVPYSIGSNIPMYIEFKNFEASAGVWNPNVTTSAAWLTDWTTQKTILLYNLSTVEVYVRGVDTKLYYGYSSPGCYPVIQVLDYVDAIETFRDLTDVILFQSYFPSTMTRQAGRFDYVRVGSS